MADKPHHVVVFQRSGRGKAQCPANPAYPHGIAIDSTQPGELSCAVSLPYPAPECGMWLINCLRCGMTLAITAAGRADDPVSVTMACLNQGTNAIN